MAGVANAQLVNTARLTGTAVTQAVMVTGILASGKVTSVTTGLTCVSADSSAVPVDTDCNALRLTGEETTGSTMVTINVEDAAGLKARFSVSSMLPTSVSITASHSRLLPIYGWIDQSDQDCASYMYQQATVTVMADFDQGKGANSFQADVTSLIADLLTSDSTQIVSVSQGTVSGVGVGSTTVGFAPACNGCLHDSVNFVVDDSDFIYPVAVDARPVSGVTLKVTESSLALFGTTTAAFEVKGATLTSEGDSVAIVANLVLSDLSRIPLTTANGLVLVSRDNATVDVQGLNAFVPVNGVSASGSLLDAVWTPSRGSSCGEAVALATGNVTLEVKLPPPKSASVTLTQAKLAVVNGPSAAAGVPTSSVVRVSMTYANGATRDMTLDSRTLYNTTLIDGFARLARVGNQMVISALNGVTAAASGALSVRFTFTNKTAVVGLQVR